MARVYVDTCIYLNLWQKEVGNPRGIPYWLIAQKLLKKCFGRNIAICYSGFILKELSHILSEEEFAAKRDFFNNKQFMRIFISRKDINKAMKMQHEGVNMLGFHDVIHLSIAKKENAIFITRDRALLQYARQQGIPAKRPEEFLKEN